MKKFQLIGIDNAAYLELMKLKTKWFKEEGKKFTFSEVIIKLSKGVEV